MLETAHGKSDMEVADQLGTTRATVGKWRRRFLRDRCDGLLDEPRPGAPRTIGDDDVERVVVRTLESLPRDATRWSTRSMAKACGLSSATVSRIWRAFALKPHRSETFKLSRDPQFIESQDNTKRKRSSRGRILPQKTFENANNNRRGDGRYHLNIPDSQAVIRTASTLAVTVPSHPISAGPTYCSEHTRYLSKTFPEALMIRTIDRDIAGEAHTVP